MKTLRIEQCSWLPAVSGRRGARGVAGLGLVGAATLMLASAACTGSARPANTTPEPLSANATVALAAAAVATPATPAAAGTTAARSATPAAASSAATRATPAAATPARKSAIPTGATPAPTPAAADSGKKAAKRDALATVQLTAGAVTQSLQRHNLAAGQVQAVTSQNDPDGKLGKPNQYTSRADFLDPALANGGDWSLANGGAVEVFGSAKDAVRAKKQLQAGNSGSTPSEIDYQAGPILLRLSPRLSQPQIANYEKATKDTLKAAVKAEEGRKKGAKKPVTATPAP